MHRAKIKREGWPEEGPTMKNLSITPEQADLVIELLEKEGHELSVEIRRADMESARAVLRDRLQRVDKLLEELRSPVAH
jgi:hypothetical protein